MQFFPLQGAKQYLIFAAGYDSFAYRQPPWGSRLKIFEIDHPETAKDKQTRLLYNHITIPSNVHYVHVDLTTKDWPDRMIQHNRFDQNQLSFFSMLGFVYYISEQKFIELVSHIGGLLPKGSTIVFDYPDEETYTEKAGERVNKQLQVAGEANETMLSSYSYNKMEQLLAENGFLIYEHLTPKEITYQFFAQYNGLPSNINYPILAFDHVNYCQAVKI